MGKNQNINPMPRYFQDIWAPVPYNFSKLHPSLKPIFVAPYVVLSVVYLFIACTYCLLTDFVENIGKQNNTESESSAVANHVNRGQTKKSFHAELNEKMNDRRAGLMQPSDAAAMEDDIKRNRAAPRELAEKEFRETERGKLMFAITERHESKNMSTAIDGINDVQELKFKRLIESLQKKPLGIWFAAGLNRCIDKKRQLRTDEDEGHDSDGALSEWGEDCRSNSST